MSTSKKRPSKKSTVVNTPGVGLFFPQGLYQTYQTRAECLNPRFRKIASDLEDRLARDHKSLSRQEKESLKSKIKEALKTASDDSSEVEHLLSTPVAKLCRRPIGEPPTLSTRPCEGYPQGNVYDLPIITNSTEEVEVKDFTLLDCFENGDLLEYSGTSKDTICRELLFNEKLTNLILKKAKSLRYLQINLTDRAIVEAVVGQLTETVFNKRKHWLAISSSKKSWGGFAIAHVERRVKDFFLTRTTDFPRSGYKNLLKKFGLSVTSYVGDLKPLDDDQKNVLNHYYEAKAKKAYALRHLASQGSDEDRESMAKKIVVGIDLWLGRPSPNKKDRFDAFLRNDNIASQIDNIISKGLSGKDQEIIKNEILNPPANPQKATSLDYLDNDGADKQVPVGIDHRTGRSGEIPKPAIDWIVGANKNIKDEEYRLTSEELLAMEQFLKEEPCDEAAYKRAIEKLKKGKKFLEQFRKSWEEER